MAVGNGARRLRRQNQNGKWWAREDDPMSSMVNLMDVMLVFACGLLVALISHYGMSLGDDPQSANQGNAEALDADLQESPVNLSIDDLQYAEVGTIYRDTETGTLYVVGPNESKDLAQ